MEYPWRHPPLPPAQVNPNICPTCSISHFPFCPSPPSSFNQNPRFQSPSTYSLHRRFYEPYVDQRPWHRNPSLGDNNYDDGLASSGYDHIGAGYKRMRADEVDLGSAANDNHVNTPGISVDNERRLKLIRDHGGADSISGICVDVNQDTREYLPKSSVFERGPGGIDTVKRGRFDEPGFGVDDHFPTSYEANDLRDPRLSNYDRKGFYPEPDFNRHNYGEGYGSRFDQKISQSYRNEDLGRSNRYSLGTHDFPGDSLSANEAQYYHQTGWQGQSGSSLHQEHRSSFLMENRGPNHFSPQPYALQNNVRLNHDIHYCGYSNDRRQSYGDTILPHDGNRGPIGHQFLPTASQIDPQFMIKQDGHVPLFPGNTTISENTPAGAGRVSNVQPPLPASPPPPLSVDHQRHPLSDPHVLPSEAKSSSLFPISVTSSASLPSSYAPFSEAHPLAQSYFQDKSHPHASTGSATELVSQRLSMNYSREGQRFHLISSNKPKAVDASHILKQPHRATRPDHIVVILRGLPGSGKSYLAKMMRDLEVENGGNPPRIHSMDDYFMTEVEKIEESDISKSSGSFRGKKPVVKKVMDYCYEPEMEEAYRSSMLKTFKKTLDEGAFPFVIVDDRNLRVADFAQFWATAKRSGYEVYLLEATYKDPAGCAARNVHGFTLDGIQKMAGQWEEAPSLYLKLDIKSLLRGDDLKENGIQEVDMDTEDGDSDGPLHGSGEINSDHSIPASHNYSPAGLLKADENWNAERDHLKEEVKELGRSKWSNDLEDDNANRTEGSKGNPNALSGLIKAYTKEGKSVHWGDQVGNTGFSIGSAKKVNISLVIGPGAGYNLKSNPLPEELVSPGNTGESKKHSVFQERTRAERDSFRAVFDKRRHRIGGLDLDEE